MKPLSYSAAVMGLGWLLGAVSGCSDPAEAPSAGKKEQAGESMGAVASGSTVADVSDGDLRAFGSLLEARLRGRRTDEASQMFDFDGIVNAIYQGIEMPGQSVQQLKAGMKQGIGNGVAVSLRNWVGHDAKFKGPTRVKGQSAVRFRFIDANDSVTIVDFVVNRKADGSILITDVCNRNMGYELVQQTRLMSAPLAVKFEGELQRETAHPISLSEVERQMFGELVRMFGAQDYTGVKATYERMTGFLKERVATTAMYLQALQHTGDQEVYVRALRDAAARFWSPEFQFMLLNVYVIEGEYEKAVGCLDEFMKRVGVDAALLTIKSTLLNAMGDATAARAVLEQALQLEPDCRFVHDNGLAVMNAVRDWPALRDSIMFLEKNHGFNFREAIGDPRFDDFKRAAESQLWR